MLHYWHISIFAIWHVHVHQCQCSDSWPVDIFIALMSQVFRQKSFLSKFLFSSLISLQQSLMLAERSCVYNILISLMESREEGKECQQTVFLTFILMPLYLEEQEQHWCKLSQQCSNISLSTELKGLGADFTFGFVQSVDGERDPRNLLLAFQVARNIIHRGYDLG